MVQTGFRLIVYARDRWYEACPTLRVEGPATSCGFEVIPGYNWDNGVIRIDPTLAEDASCVLICRDFPRYSEECLDIIARAHRKRIPLLYETDDILFDIPVEHPDFLFYQAAAPMIFLTMLEADRVITSTPYLKEKLKVFHPDVQVVPNSLDDRFWKLEDRQDVKETNGTVTIGYFGTHTHRNDLEMIQPVLLDVLEQFGNRVLLKIWGGCRPPGLADHPRVELVNEGIFDYARFAEHIQKQQVDFWIAPLADRPFNRAKSAIKFLEYSATGSPGIFTRIDPYEAVVKDGENGFLASDPFEWTTHLSQLIKDQPLRKRMGQNALQTVRAQWLLSRNASIFGQAILSCRSRELGQEFYSSSSTIAAIRSLGNGNKAVLERLDRLSYLEKALTENKIAGSIDAIGADELFRLLRDAQQYGAARDMELAAVRSSTTYRLGGTMARMLSFVPRLLNRRYGTIGHPQKKD